VSWLEGVLAIVGLALITLVTRAFFLYPERDLPLPAWLLQGLRYAPLAALAAVVAPEIVMTQGRLIDTWMDARLPGVAAAIAYYAWRGLRVGSGRPAATAQSRPEAQPRRGSPTAAHRHRSVSAAVPRQR
jgi:branched-subunit amino acid transport protein